jgi:hypothetical protein
MTTSEVIKKLQKIEAKAGKPLPVKLEAKASGLNWADEDGIGIYEHTVGVDCAEIHGACSDHECCTQNDVVWLIGKTNEKSKTGIPVMFTESGTSRFRHDA